MTDEQDLNAYLRSKGVQTHRAAGAEVTVHCMFCQDGDTKGKGKLYLNTETWLYSCKRCDAVGNRRSLLAHFGDEDDLQHVEGADPALRRKLLAEAADLAHQMLLGNDDKLTYLLDRGIAPELIAEHKLGYVPRNVGLSEMLPSRGDLKGYRELINAGLVTVNGKEFFNDCLTIPYFSHGSVVQIRAKFVDGKYLTTAGDHVRLHNADALHGADQVLVTEGELDDFAVRSALMDANDRSFTEGLAVVGLPGAGSWPEHLVDMLSGASKVFIGLDPDETGRKFSAKLKDAIGSKAREVRLPGDDNLKVDWTDYLKAHDPVKNPYGGHTWRDVRDLMVEADLAGKQMFSVGDARAKWRKRQVEAPGLKLGWPSLDAIIKPGVKPGQIVIPLAKSGTGKSVWLSNVAMNLRQHHVLYASLELTAAEVYEHWRRIHRFWYPDADEDQLVADLARLRVVERNRLKRGDLEILINEYEDEVGRKPELVIVDYLQYYARGFPGGGMYERVSDAAMELKAVAKENSLAIICPSQVNRGAEHGKPLTADDARDSGVVDETGDFVFSLFRPDQLVNKDDLTGALPMQSGNFNLQILKSRHGGKGHLSNLRMSLMSLVIVDAVLDRTRSSRVEQENSLYRQGMHYDDYRSMLDSRIAQRPLQGVGA